MPSRRHLLRSAAATLATGAALAAGCALSPFAEAPRVHLVGLDSLPGEGLELRFMLHLRVQNPNDAELAYDGISLDLDLRGQRFASGVAPVAGRIPRYGETVVNVPVSVSALAMARQLVDLLRASEKGGGVQKLPYRLQGRLGGPLLGTARFESSGEIDLGGR